ncbi:MAG: TonB-dependent receptor, partial [Bacteroidales bacterium]|nr:TonB-dependent receptor [Bacteroidales bacterium]
TLMIASKLDYKAGKVLSGELQINYARRNPLYHIQYLNSGTDSSNRYYEKDHEFTLNHLNTLKVSGNNLVRIGMLYTHWVSPHGKRYYYGHRADVHTWSTVFTDQQQLGKWLLDAGFRISREYYKDWAAFSIEGSGKKFSGVQPITNEWQSPVWQASAGASWSAHRLLSLHTNLSAGIVTPRKGALTADSLPPVNEKRTNFDLGLRKMFEGQGSLTVTTFLVNRKDALDYSGSTMELENGTIIELYKNEDKRNYGIEVALRMQLAGEWLQGFANATFMKGQTGISKNRIADKEIPSFIGNLGCSFQKAGFDGNFFLNYTGPFENDRFISKTYLQEHGKAPLGNFFNISLTAGYSFGKKSNTRVSLEVRNILNTPFQTVPGWPDYGRRINIGINLRL